MARVHEHEGGTGKGTLRQRLNSILTDHHTPGGKVFDIFLICAIILSIALVMLDSVHSIHLSHGATIHKIEWIFTILFTIEYLLRITCAERPGHYIGSFYGIIDVLSFLPTYLGAFMLVFETFFILRILRLLRLFRVFKMARTIDDASVIFKAVKASGRKILIFLFSIVIFVILTGACMYIIEGPQNGFESIPMGVYWSISTISTVGFGDIYPVTAGGRFFASLLMIISYTLLAVPTGIITLELSRASGNQGAQHDAQRRCFKCSCVINDHDAKFCKQCGQKL
jgi:voltage-gated potassium channel